MQQPYEEDDGLGWGTAATALGGLALASPMGRPFRKKAANIYEHFRSPFATQVQGLGSEFNKIGSTLRNDIAQKTGFLSELGARTYNAGPAYRAVHDPERYANTGELSSKATAQNWSDTIGGIKDIARAVAAMSAATPEAIKALRKQTKLGEDMRIAPKDWEAFLNHRASKGFSTEALDEMSRYAVTDPFAAALMYLRNHNA